MKIDLTHRSRPEQVALVIGYLTERIENRRSAPSQIHATDLATKFKHRGAGAAASQRLAFWNQLLRDAGAAIQELAKLKAHSISPENTAP